MHARSNPAGRAVLRTAIVAAALAAPMAPGPVLGAPVPEVDADLAAAMAARERLTLADRVAQLVTTSVPGTSLSARDARLLRTERFGGVIVFGENYRAVPQLRRFTRALQAAAGAGDATHPRALVSIDQEGGLVKRLPDAAPTRSHPQLGAADRPALTRAQGAATGRALRSVGVQFDLAPVADLDLAPRRVMGPRSFGTTPALVSRHVVAFAGGLRDAHVAAAAKHFPGFGGASVNSDDALARVSRTPLQLRADRAPFAAAADAGIDAIMMSHGIYAAIDRRRPASTSPAAYRQLRALGGGYDGVAITDSLHAAGFRAATGRSAADGCVPAVAAGADIALLTGSLADAAACRRRLLAAARSGALPRERVDEAVLRVLRLKARLGLLPDLSSPEPAPPAG